MGQRLEPKSARSRQLDRPRPTSTLNGMRNRSGHAPTRRQHTYQLTDMSINPRAGVLRASLRFVWLREPPKLPKHGDRVQFRFELSGAAQFCEQLGGSRRRAGETRPRAVEGQIVAHYQFDPNLGPKEANPTLLFRRLDTG